MEHLQLQLNMLSLGHLSPSVISPRDLRKMLTEIRAQLPPFLKLPNDPGRELWKFYQSLACATILDHAQFLVIVSVCLLDAVNKFEVYNIYNLPLPIKDPNVAVKEMPNMVAEFKLESKLLAINLEQMKYILLTSAELESCTSPLHHYCDIRSPVYPINLSKLCIAAYCQTTVKPNFLLPMALHIIQGLWVIASQKDLRFSVTYPEDKRSIFISRPPLDTIKLGMSCSTTSDYLTFLPYYHNESRFAVSNPLGNRLTSSNSTRFQLWEPILSKLPNFTKMELPPELKDVKEIPMRHLILRLRHTKLVKKENPYGSTSLLL